MGTHLIPREVEGEGRILIIFSAKGFVGTLIGIVIGAMFFTFFDSVGASIIGGIFLILFGLAGFIIGQVKLPKSNSFNLLKKTGGDYVYEIIVKYFNFRQKRKIYTYDKGGEKK